MPSKTETVDDLNSLPLAAAARAPGAVAARPAPTGISLTPRQVLLGDIDMRIDRDGNWHYLGSPITRQALVSLFAGVLRRDTAGDYWLITPAEVARLRVDAVPFQAVAMQVTGAGPAQVITFRTNVDRIVALSAARPLRVETDPESGAPCPILVVADDGTEARVTRPVFYDLVDLGVMEKVDQMFVFGVWSNGDFFPLADPDDAALMETISEELNA